MTLIAGLGNQKDFNTTNARIKSATLIFLFGAVLGLTACGGGGGGSGGTNTPVTNNGTLSNPQNYTMPSGGVSTVPPTGNQ